MFFFPRTRRAFAAPMSKLLSCLYKKRWVTLWVLPRHSFWRITDHVHVCIKRLSLLGVLLWIVPFFTSLLWIVPCFYKLTLDCFKSLISGRYIVYDDLGTRISVFVGFQWGPTLRHWRWRATPFSPKNPLHFDILAKANQQLQNFSGVCILYVEVTALSVFNAQIQEL